MAPTGHTQGRDLLAFLRGELSVEQRAELSMLASSIPAPELPREHTAVAFLNQGHFLITRGEIGDALLSYERAATMDALLWQAHGMKAIVLSMYCVTPDQIDLFECARSGFETCLKLNPKFAAGFRMFGNLLERMNFAAAASCWQRAVELDEKDFAARTKLSMYLVHCQGQYEKGVAVLEEGFKFDPDYLKAYSDTSYYEFYLKGEMPEAISGHVKRMIEHVHQRRKAHEIDTLPFRVITGISPFIGHYYYLDTYVKARMLGLYSGPACMVLAPRSQIANAALLAVWSKHIPVISDPLLLERLAPLERLLELDNNSYAGFADRFFGDQFILQAEVQAEWERQGRKPLLSISDDHIDRGRKLLHSLGVPEDAWFVAVHARDDGFKGVNPRHALRNADIASYRKAFHEITARGGWVIRMGDRGMTPLEPMHQVIDYAHSSIKSDWMDVFLWSSSRFFIGGNSGPSWIPNLFGVPVVRVNWTPLTRVPWNGADIIIPKLFYCQEEKRLLTLQEVVDPRGRVGWTHDCHALRDRQVIPLDNSEDEIHEVVLEMLAKLDMQPPAQADIELQSDAANIIQSTVRGYDQGDRTCRLGLGFLKRYRHIINTH